MGLLGKIMCMVACAVGVVCTLAPIIVEGDHIRHADDRGSKYKGSVSCMFIAFFIFLAGLVCLFVTLCCPCSSICMGILIAAIGGASLFFTICAYALAKNANDVSLLDKPNTPEWLFGSIISSVCVILCSLTLATSSV